MTDLFRIKPLNWSRHGKDAYHVHIPAFGYYYVCKQENSFRWGVEFEADSPSWFDCASIEAGRTLAENHWKHRIESCLEKVEKDGEAMKRKIEVKGSTLRKIEVDGSPKRKISPEEFAEAIGAEKDENPLEEN